MRTSIAGLRTACVAGVALVAIAAPAFADLPLSFLSPSLQGSGQATIVSALDGHEIFVNGFNGLAFSGFNEYDPFDPRVFRVSRSGTTGGGIGGPPPASVYSQAMVQTSAGLLESLNISASASSFGSTREILPDQRGSVSGGATAGVSFVITDPVFAQWTGGEGTSLLFNGSPVFLNPSSIILLQPGNYVASAHCSGFGVAPVGQTTSFGAGNSFNLLVGVPAPAGVATIGLAGLLAARRRR